MDSHGTDTLGVGIGEGIGTDAATLGVICRGLEESTYGGIRRRTPVNHEGSRLCLTAGIDFCRSSGKFSA